MTIETLDKAEEIRNQIGFFTIRLESIKRFIEYAQGHEEIELYARLQNSTVGHTFNHQIAKDLLIDREISYLTEKLEQAKAEFDAL
jgi:hypothetical protein